MTTVTEAARDVRDLLGMHTAPARILVGIYTMTGVVLAYFGTDGVTEVWPLAVAALVFALAAFSLVSVAGDPLPLGLSLLLMLTGVVTAMLVFSVVSVPPSRGVQLWWPMGMSTVIFTFMCVRGRTILAWIGLCCMIATATVWTHVTGQGAGYGLSAAIPNAAPVLMSTFFAYTFRPLSRSIFVLRGKSLQRIAEEAATAAALEERDAQLDRLDELARPLLERIATGEPLDSEQRRDGVLLEARLRDGLRAPMLQDPLVIAATTAARRRGVDVVMLDDRGMDGVPAAERARIRRAVAEELDTVTEGSVTVRVLPPGRRTLVSVLVRGESVRRREFGRDDAG